MVRGHGAAIKRRNGRRSGNFKTLEPRSRAFTEVLINDLRPRPSGAEITGRNAGNAAAKSRTDRGWFRGITSLEREFYRRVPPSLYTSSRCWNDAAGIPSGNSYVPVSGFDAIVRGSPAVINSSPADIQMQEQ